MSGARLAATRVLAISATILAGLPLAAPLVLAVISLVVAGGLHLDFLMPGELFILVPVGGGLLVVAAFLAGRRRRLAVIAAAVPILLFAILTLLTAVTGIGSGDSPAAGWRLVATVGTYGLYVAAVIALVVVGVILCREVNSLRDKA